MSPLGIYLQWQQCRHEYSRLDPISLTDRSSSYFLPSSFHVTAIVGRTQVSQNSVPPMILFVTCGPNVREDEIRCPVNQWCRTLIAAADVSLVTAVEQAAAVGVGSEWEIIYEQSLWSMMRLILICSTRVLLLLDAYYPLLLFHDHHVKW